MEEWRAIPGYEGFYEASSEGNIRTMARRVPCKGGTRAIKSRLLRQACDADGYAIVSLSAGGKQKSFRWNRVILLTFRGPALPGQEGRHLDGVRSRNVLSNLAWGTPKQNWADRKAHGRGVEGDKNPNSYAYRSKACIM